MYLIPEYSIGVERMHLAGLCGPTAEMHWIEQYAKYSGREHEHSWIVFNFCGNMVLVMKNVLATK